jgi:hypothetical protein
MEATVLVAPDVVDELRRFERVALFIDAPTEEERKNKDFFSEKFKIATIPAYYVLDAQGRVLASQIGATDEKGFLEFLRRGRGDE